MFPMPSRHSSPASATARILLVDDNAHGLTARKNVLEEVGHRVSTCTSASDALETFGRQRFDLVVTDYKMPRMDGLELIQSLRKISPDLPVILVSGFVDALGLTESNTGADSVIQKSSHEVSHLLRAVSRLLRRKPARKGNSGEAPKAKRKAV